MRLRVKKVNLSAGKPVAFLHEKDAKAMHLRPGERIGIKLSRKEMIAIADVVNEGFLKKGEVALSQEIVGNLHVTSKNFVEINPVNVPKSSKSIQLRIRCKPYTKEELARIMEDIASNALSEVEIAYFISGVNYCGMSLKETRYLTEAVFETGQKISWGNRKVADKHSIGGIPGNRTTPIVVSICAAAGILFPKTSSRAITSAAGTADAVESVARVDLSLKELKRIVEKTGACLAWGGSLGLAPADDKLIRIEKVLNLDPEPQLLASILAKKLSVGSKYVLIDIPCGEGAKVSREKAVRLKKKFQTLGKMLGMDVKAIITDGTEPIGNGVGPVLEMKDVIRVLQRNDSPRDLEKKSIKLSGEILEMMGKAKKGQGEKLAAKILDSGDAFKKFKQIIKAQSGSLDNLKTAKYTHQIVSLQSGKVSKIDNYSISYAARLAGCPIDKATGIYLHKHKKDHVTKGEVIAEIHSESRRKLREAVDFFNEFKPIKIH